MRELDFRYNDQVVQDFMGHFEILDVHFYSSTMEPKGYIKIKVEEEIFECDFELEEHLTMMKEIIVRKTKESYSLELFLDEMFEIIPENKRNYGMYIAIYKSFNEYFVYKMEETGVIGIGKKLRKAAQINFTEFKPKNKDFIIMCDLTIFNKEFKFHFTKASDYTSLQIDGIGNANDYNDWFLQELITNEYNKEGSLFYVDAPRDYFYGIVGILGEIITLEFKDTKYFKMAILYDDDFKILFE
jgi:hypothetical protein